MDNSNNKRILKNTVFLYFRMFITIAVGLYTSRVILNTLGVTDYGIYNVVGGIINMAAFLNAGMVQASQRFIAFELGRKDKKRLHDVFCTSVSIHLLIALIILLIGETVGLWFVNTHLNIPENRMIAANWVYQASILSFMITILSVPYNACIVAHEKMSAFAYISILEVVLKLLIVFMLLAIPYDKLISYSVLIVMVSLTVRSVYTIYCKRFFEECYYQFIFDRNVFTRMFSFAGWSMIGNLGYSFRDQLSNIMLNIYYGTTLNAARGIAFQVNSILTGFSTNLLMSVSPQITKQYANGNIEEMRKLIYTSSRYCFYLMMLISIPVIVNADFILSIWLGIVPEYAAAFLKIALLASLLYTLSSPVTIGVQATGRLKWFQIGICVIMFIDFALTWLFLALGWPPYYAMLPSIFTNLVALCFRFWLLRHYILGYSAKQYYIQTCLRTISVFGVSYLCTFKMCAISESNLLSLILNSILCILICFIVIYILGINKQERVLLHKFIKGYLCRFHSIK
jgi:O-antigen/teichoic acid export membrane protein